MVALSVIRMRLPHTCWMFLITGELAHVVNSLPHACGDVPIPYPHINFLEVKQVAEKKLVGEMVETLIRIKDAFYARLTLREKEALDDACNLLVYNVDELTSYDYTCKVEDDERRF